MKTFIVAAVLAAVIAAPALAQTTGRRPAQQAQPDAQPYAQSYGRIEIQRRLVDPSAVYDGGTYLGADPDPNIQLNLRMDYEHRDF